jgi:hypothetical protein
MLKKIIIMAVAFSIAISFTSLCCAQAFPDKARDLFQQAIILEDKQDFSTAIKLIEQAQKLDPRNLTYLYEVGYCYYSTKNYPQAIAVLTPLTSRKDVTSNVFRVLGNSYDLIGDTPKALETFDAGIAQFPAAGYLYLEAGGIHVDHDADIKALKYFEAGIKNVPAFPSNYYWAAKLYCNSNKRVNGLVYGELFMNLERNSERSIEISKLLFDTYKQGVTLMPGSQPVVDFSGQTAVSIAKGISVVHTKLPFSFAYEPVMRIAFESENTLDLNSLDRARTKFLFNYHKLKMDAKYPNVLFDYQDKVLKAGHLSVYNHWLLMHGDEAQFNEWKQEHRNEWNAFLSWYNANPIKLTELNKFYSGQYN